MTGRVEPLKPPLNTSLIVLQTIKHNIMSFMSQEYISDQE